jgi:putative Mg2+ transporter-C (MgtC) family protein
MDFLREYSLQFGILGQCALAMVLGALIGVDRELARKPAGLRTHMLVAGASALIVNLAEVSVMHFNAMLGDGFVQADPVKIFVAVVTGISFLGAGTIIRQNHETRVSGLTTAASLLFSAVIGMSVALSQYVLAVGSTVLAIFVLWILGRLEAWLTRQ